MMLDILKLKSFFFFYIYNINDYLVIILFVVFTDVSQD